MMMMAMVMVMADEAAARTDTDIDCQIMATPRRVARSVILTAPHYSSRVLNRDGQACERGSINAAAAADADAASDSGN